MAELNLRSTAVNAIRRMHSNVKSPKMKDLDMIQLEQELKIITAHFDRFVVNHDKLVSKASSAEELAAHEQLWEEIEDDYKEVCVMINRAILVVKAEADTAPHKNKEHGTFQMKLDPLPIPTFDGAMHNWLAFKDAFETLVHRTDFPEAYKLGKLRQAVTASAVPLIGGLYSGGYEEVWKAMKERYDNRKQLAEIHVSRFLNIRTASEDTAKALLAIVDAVNESLRALRVMELPVASCDALAVPIVTSKLPVSTQREWCMCCSPDDIPKLVDLLNFLEKRAHSLSSETLKLSNRFDSSSSRQHRSEVQSAQRICKSHVTTIDEGKCSHCQGSHRVMRCPLLQAMTTDQRFEALKGSRLCFNCLKPGHASRQCPSGGCRHCRRKHNSLLCRASQAQVVASTLTGTAATSSSKTFVSTAPQASKPADPVISCVAQGSHTVLLATARVYAYGEASEQRVARILCDPGSQVSFVSDRLANHLNLRRSKYEVAVEGIGATAHTRTKGSVVLTLKSIHSDFTLNVNALVITSITSVTPTVPINVRQWQHLNELQLDPHFGTPGSIDILIGADLWGLIVEGDIVNGKQEEPHAQRTRLGWVVFGPAVTSRTSAQSLVSFRAKIQEEDIRLDELVSNFWKLEEVPSNESGGGGDECARLYAATHSRTTDGRYMVKIPFCRDAVQLGESYPNALKQFYYLERRLATNPDIREKYIAFMREFTSLGHMERMNPPGDHANCYYIPHHAVTSKFRVVFNASARTTTGVSLNDIQLAGPTIQDSLINIIFRFRRYRIAITADIEKMFRQILVAPKHRDYQRIIWRESPEQEIEIHRLTTVTYGMACSPYNAIRSLHQCAHDNYQRVSDHKQAIAARDSILTSFYVDDYLTSCNHVSDAKRLAANVDTVLMAGHFKLRKWNSNSIDVLRCIAGGATFAEELTIESPTASVLGLKWDPAADELFFNITLKQTCDPPTKRRVLSEVAQLFDPTGLVAPVVITGKIILQKIWSKGISWDTPLSSELLEQWIKFRTGLDSLKQIRVPRWLGMDIGEASTLHGFCDASQDAYAAAIYMKTTDTNGHPRISLLTARTKVAPLKRGKGETIPNLELCAARLLAITFDNVRVALGLIDTPYFLWSDSSIVLCWLRKQPTTLKPYVANRVRQIQEITSPDNWHHVRSNQNPADCASRGLAPSELLKHRLWWEGPEWLKNETTPLPRYNPLNDDELVMFQCGEKVSSLAVSVPVSLPLTTRRRDGQTIELTDRFSSLPRLLRTVALILRWCPGRQLRHQSTIGARELDDALQRLIRIEQGNVFKNDVNQLQNSSRLLSSSRLRQLNPYIDQEGVMRVGGRIGKSELPHDQRFPIILPRSSGLVLLLIQQAHDSTLHGGTQLMLQTLRRHYWILNARQAVRSYLSRCVVCRRYRASTLTQQMSPLPGQRVNAARPFLSTGVDYCGPFTLRIGAKRSRMTVKTYLSIFVCMATKAVHIEVVDDLSSHAFLDAYTRFTSRRGICRDLYSDNGTAFVGANRLLKEDLQARNSEHNQRSLADMGTQWHFIAPRAPHQGGLWEAAVKSAKHHLVRVVGSQKLWHSQLQTLAARIEACLNSRPLIPLHDDPDDKLALTPGDFLIGAPLIALPEPSVNDVPVNRLKHWQWLRSMHQQFWQRWSEEYLSTLQTRNKWQHRVPDIEIGDIVIVRHEDLPPTHWRLGRVIKVHPGSDGLVRNVTLKTSTGQCTRAVQKLCRLMETENFEPTTSSSTGQDV